MNAQATAHHEAGHAVIAHALGFAIKEVSIKPDDDDNRLGHILYPLYTFQLNMTHRSYRSEVREFLVTTLAGHISEQRFTGAANEDGAAGDDERVNDTLLGIYGENASRHRRELERQAHRLISAHWQAIQRVAAALLERETLSDADVAAIDLIEVSA